MLGRLAVEWRIVEWRMQLLWWLRLVTTLHHVVLASELAMPAASRLVSSVDHVLLPLPLPLVLLSPATKYKQHIYHYVY